MNSSNASLIFLGTGTSQGIPVIGSNHPVCHSSDSKDKRLRSSVYIEIEDSQFLIDCGPDFRQQILSNGLSQLTAILFTHEHNDHVIGLDDVRPIFFRIDGNIDLYGLPRVLDAIQNRFPYAFEMKKYPGTPGFNLHSIKPHSTIQIQNHSLVPIPIYHGRLPILGYRIKNLAYLTDVSKIQEEGIALLQNLDVLIISALRKEPKHDSHLMLDEAIEISKQLHAKKTYFTHISHLMGFHEEVQKELPKNMYLAYDGLKINF